MRLVNRLFRSFAAVVLGYAVIVICTSVGFARLGGIVHLNAPFGVQAAAALVAIVSGLLGGLTASIVAGSHPVRHAAAVLIFLAIDTGVVLSRHSEDPAWFELSGSATLMIATILGGVLYLLVVRRNELEFRSCNSWRNVFKS